VTGVQTCALPICAVVGVAVEAGGSVGDRLPDAGERADGRLVAGELHRTGERAARNVGGDRFEVGAGPWSHEPIMRLAVWPLSGGWGGPPIYTPLTRRFAFPLGACVMFRSGGSRASNPRGGVPERPNGTHC